MKLVLSLGIALALCTIGVCAQNVDPEPTPTPKNAKVTAPAKPAATPAPTPDKKAKNQKPDETKAPAAAPAEEAKPKLSFWERIFGRKDRKPKAEASPTPTPSPSPKPKPKTKRPAPTPADAALVSPDSTPQTTPPPRPRPTPKVTASNSEDQLSNQVPFVGTENETPVSMVPDPADEAAEKAKYKTVRSQALEDSRILKLQDKSDSATTASEQKTASKAYYKALFNKMRELDPSLKERIDRMESATIKRIDEGGSE